MLALFLAALLLRLRPAVHAGDALGTQADGSAHTVHRRIAAADDEDVLVLAVHWLAHVLRKLLRLQIAAYEKLRRLIDVRELLALNPHLPANRRACSEEHGVVAAFAQQLVDRHVLADHGVADELDAHALEILELVLQDLLAHLEVRNAVQQDSPRHGPGLEYRAGMPLFGQLLRHGEPRRPGPDDCHPASRRRGHRRDRDAAVSALVVGDERLQLADRDGRLLAVRRRTDREADHACALAEGFLRAESAAHVGQVAGLAKLVRGGEDIALLEEDQRRRDVVPGRAGVLAGRGRAVNTALRFDNRRLETIAQERLVPVVYALRRLLLRHGLHRYRQPSQVVVRSVELLRCHGDLDWRTDTIAKRRWRRSAYGRRCESRERGVPSFRACGAGRTGSPAFLAGDGWWRGISRSLNSPRSRWGVTRAGCPHSSRPSSARAGYRRCACPSAPPSPCRTPSAPRLILP